MKKSLLLLPLTMAFLCGCKESSSIQTYQPPINVVTSVVNEESAVKKTTKASSKTSTKSTKNATTTTTTAPKTNTSTIKDLIIDGNGNLVATKSNNTFAIIGNVQGQKGAKGDTGERGTQGEKGQDGRGIDHCELDVDKNLIVYYTDGTSQNVGCVAISETPTHDYEQVGYELTCVPSLPHSVQGVLKYNKNDIPIELSINNISIKLIGVDESNPSKKYKYSQTINISRNNFDYENFGISSTSKILFYYNGGAQPFWITLDQSQRTSISSVGFLMNSDTMTLSDEFYSSLPYSSITSLSFPSQNGVEFVNAQIYN